VALDKTRWSMGAQCDCVHAETITQAYVVRRERLRRANQTTLYALPQARCGSRHVHETWQRQIRRGEENPWRTAHHEISCKDGQPVSHRLTNARICFLNVDGSSWMRKKKLRANERVCTPFLARCIAPSLCIPTNVRQIFNHVAVH
jgi:hypothetical protein